MSIFIIFLNNDNRKKKTTNTTPNHKKQYWCSSNTFVCLFRRKGIVIILKNVASDHLHHSGCRFRHLWCSGSSSISFALLLRLALVSELCDNMMSFITCYLSLLFRKSEICLPFIMIVDVPQRWPCYSPYMVYLHWSAAQCFRRCYTVRRMLPCAWRSFQALTYQKGAGDLLRYSLLQQPWSLLKLSFFIDNVMTCQMLSIVEQNVECENVELWGTFPLCSFFFLCL